MRKAVDHAAMAVAGYTTPWTATAGQDVNLHLSAAQEVLGIRLLRLDTPEVQPTGWPVRPSPPLPGKSSPKGHSCGSTAPTWPRSPR